MPHLSGVFDEFPDLDKVPVEEIISWLKQKPEIHSVVNFFGNRVIYPQAVPLTNQEMEIDLAILRQGIKLKPGLVYEPQANRIIIPERFVERFPNIAQLSQSIIEAINPKGEHAIYIKHVKNLSPGKAQLQLIGSVIGPLNPQRLSNDDKTVTFSSIEGAKTLILGQINLIQSQGTDLKILVGGVEFTASGGQAGIFIDLRRGSFQ